MQMKALFFVLCGILFVKAIPFHPDSPIDLFKLNETQGKFEFNSNNLSVATLNSNKTLEVAKPEENNEVTKEINITESTLVEESNPIKETAQKEGISQSHSHHEHNNFHGHGEHEHASRNMGPVESGLRNVVSASAIATEELFMEMAAIRGETLEMISTKSEILTSHAMNEIFKPLSQAEAEIKKHQECGRQFVSSFNAILSQIDSNLKTCVHNLTLVGANYKNQSTQILASISIIAEEIQNLPESCEIGQHFAIGTFCTVNNLAETNSRVVMSVKDMRFITAVAKENISKAASSTVACQKHFSQAVFEKLKKLFNEVGEKCNQQTKPQHNEN